MKPLRAIAYARHHRPRLVAELQEFVRFPSVSSQPKHARDLRRCASWLACHLRKIGLDEVKVIPTRRHPLVYAAWQRNPRHPTLLIYGHYDVQPADPLREWHTPPFGAIVHGNHLYGRGASDDKGQIFSHIKALESYLKTERSLPVNVKLVIEGEEEIGSPNLASFMKRNRTALRADAAAISDTPMLGPNQPAISYSLRGKLNLELEVRGLRRDLHSGIYGGAVHNPLQVVCEMLAKLHDASGRIAIPGFYDEVREWSAKEREYMARTGPSDTKLLQDAGAKQSWGEPGFSLYERTTVRPSLSITGIQGGYQGPGVKSVIPARAVAKLNFRLAPDQNPLRVENLLRAFVSAIAPKSMRCEVRALGASKATLIERDHPALRAAAFAYRKAFDASTRFLRCGGTIPAVNLIQENLGVPVALMGFALPADHLHAPNENIHLPNFYRSISACIWFLAAIGRSLRPEQRMMKGVRA